MATISALETDLLNNYQRHFPLVAEPFAHIAADLNTKTSRVINSLKKLQRQGAVSRVGPVFRPNRIGVSTLAALAVDAEKLEAVAALINAYPEVNHNYEREHTLNLWFVATAPNQPHLDALLADIEQSSGYAVISLPLVKEYHIDLGFKLKLNQLDKVENVNHKMDKVSSFVSQHKAQTNDDNGDLIAAIQAGLPLVERPYFSVGAQIGRSESEVMQAIAAMQTQGIIKRLGVVVRHHELGYQANAMLVWDIPDSDIDDIGKQLATVDCVTLCYQRPRVLPHWPYNLFTMIHGKDRDDVLACIQQVIAQLELSAIPHHVLFSKRRFKQQGACYRRH